MEKDVLEFYNKLMVVCHSSGIEGSVLTFDQTRDLIEFGRIKDSSLSDVLMVKDHYDALSYVWELAKNKSLLSVEHIKEINRRVMKTTGVPGNTVFGEYHTGSGAFRKVSVRAGSRTFITPNKIDREMSKLISTLSGVSSLKGCIPKIRKAAYNVHFNLVSIHPFMDGNGRTSRLLMNYVEAFHGLDLTVVAKSMKNTYIEALEESRKKESLSPFYFFMEKAYKHSKELTNSYIEKNTVKKSKGKGLSYVLF